ncbi:MAG TPA: glycosyltransferase [Bacteroidota bacterium]|jgi:glycosyltransferase involved in cell wall biosynthesis
MKIVIVGTAYPLRGGIAHFNALLARELGGRHEVRTITFKRQYPKIFFPGTTQDEPAGPSDTPPSPRLVDSINPLNWIRVGRMIRREQPDLLIFKYWLPFFGPCFGTIARCSKRNSRTKVLFICDNIIPHERRPGDILFTRYAFRQADYFIVQSDTVERELTELFPGSKYRKVPHPVYENFGTPRSKEEARSSLGITAKKVILYFGYVRRYKGLMVLIEAMARLRESGGGEILLLIVGEFYDPEPQYRDRVRDLKLESSVRFVTGYLPNEDVAVYFSAADAVVLPYLSATQSGIAQIAYNFDKPVIATSVGGLAEVVVDGTTGSLVPPNDPAALAAAIGKFYTENQEERMAGNVRNEKKKYSWKHFTEKIEELVSGK